MRRSLILLAAALATSACTCQLASAQKHTAGSSPPTAPPPKPAPAPLVPVSSGMGSLQFIPVNYGVPAPQSLTRQLESEDDRTRAAALSALGAPAQYLSRGHISFPHSIEVDFAALGTTDELDAILTVELDQHIVSAVLIPDKDNWRRVATVLFPTPFADPTTNPSTFLRTARSFFQPTHYRAVFHSYAPGANGGYTENEAQLNIFNGHAVVTTSFVSRARTCDAPATTPKAPHPGCDVVNRWLQPDPADPTHRFLLVSGSGHLSDKDLAEPLSRAHTFETSRLRTFACQPFLFSENTQHYEPTAPSTPCPAAPLTPPAR